MCTAFLLRNMIVVVEGKLHDNFDVLPREYFLFFGLR